ncbi:unnamed protein product [Thlaspi arvense]|uniref:Uncharacterized protein n=1 Tax=Thlaspi arvense TaxID=13288 RepID=A0AAU9TAD2_THLAR|nr:unnamed protein product [Thlaspi arvense]
MFEMGIHSYTQPSTSVSSVTRNIKDYGLTKECDCGANDIIDTSHSPMIQEGGDGDCHIWKWWDEAVIEELTLIDGNVGEMAEKMDFFTYLDDFYMATGEIKELKNETTKKIAKLEMELAEMKKKQSGIRIGFELQIVIAAAVVLLLLSILICLKHSKFKYVNGCRSFIFKLVRIGN